MTMSPAGSGLTTALRLSMAMFALFGMLTFLGCSDDDDEEEETELTATLVGAEEVPPVVTGGGGVTFFSLNEEQDEIAFRLEYRGLVAPVTQGHIHAAPLGLNGPIFLFLCTNLGTATPAGVTIPACPPAPGVVEGTLTAANLIPIPAQGINTFADAVQTILNGNAYVNVHSQAFPAGEVRGQIRSEADDD
jgi:hypothetical protein